MESSLLSRLDNLLSRIDEKNGKVFLKKAPELEKKTFHSLFRSPNSFKQLSLRSKSEVVFIDVRLVLQLSPFLSNLVAQLRDCCFSPHDQVDICLDQFSSHLLFLIKNLLEKGECIIKSRSEEKELEGLIQAMGMDACLQLYRRVHVEERSLDLDAEKGVFEEELDGDAKVVPSNADQLLFEVRDKKRKFTGEKSKLGFKLRRCNDCEQSFNASQIHVCVDTTNDKILNHVSEDEINKGGVDTEVISSPEVKQSIGGMENTFEEEQDEDRYIRNYENNNKRKCKSLPKSLQGDDSCFKKGEGLEMCCPHCSKVYKMMGAGRKSYEKHIQSCYGRDLTKKVKLHEFEEKSCPFCEKTYKMWGAGRLAFENHKHSCSKRIYDDECVKNENGGQLQNINSDILSNEPSIEKEKEKKECPSCGKLYFLKGCGITYDIHVVKCLDEILDSEVNTSLDSDISQNEEVNEKERKAKGPMLQMFDIHAAKRHSKKGDSEVCDISVFVDEENEAVPSKTKDCKKCGKIYKRQTHFNKHIQNCQIEASNHNESNKNKSKLTGSYDEDVVQCEICRRIFVGSEAFISHQVDCSGLKQKFPCPHGCGKEFAYKGNLKNHSMSCPLIEDDKMSTQCQDKMSTQCQDKMSTQCQDKMSAQCQICREGDFNENDLYLHLYRHHDVLRKMVHKSVSENFSNYYTLEHKKLNCMCPICGQSMKASRSPVGVHWAVEHKQMREIYLSYLKGSTNNQIDNIEDYEEVANVDDEFTNKHEGEEEEDNKSELKNENHTSKIKGKEKEVNKNVDQKEQDNPRLCKSDIKTVEEGECVAGPSTQQESRNLQDKLLEQEASASKEPRSHQEKLYDQLISDFGLESRNNIPKNDSRAIRNQLFGESESEDNSD